MFVIVALCAGCPLPFLSAGDLWFMALLLIFVHQTVHLTNLLPCYHFLIHLVFVVFSVLQNFAFGNKQQNGDEKKDDDTTMDGHVGRHACTGPGAP